MIISASRRTDIPAFYASWFMDRIREGNVVVLNPFNPSQHKQVSLHPNEIDAIVFWTRNARPLFQYLDELDRAGYNYLFLYTITGYGPPLETKCPPLEYAVKTFNNLSQRVGPSRVVWRFDPIVYMQGRGEHWIIERFEQIVRYLDGYTERVIISFLDFYRKVERRLTALTRSTGLEVADVNENHAAVARISRALAELAEQHGMCISSCAEKIDLQPFGIKPGSCIDADYLSRIFAITIPRAKDKSQRPRCRCAPSQDIGTYNTCRHGCVYCYAMS